MLNMTYIGQSKKYPISFKTISKNVVQIAGDFPVRTSGFTLSRGGKEDNWDYSGYTTVYREIDGGVQFSNDGSVWVEPEPMPEPDYSEDNTDYIPPLTNQELTEAVADLMYEVSCLQLGL